MVSLFLRDGLWSHDRRSACFGEVDVLRELCEVGMRWGWMRMSRVQCVVFKRTRLVFILKFCDRTMPVSHSLLSFGAEVRACALSFSE